MTLNRVVISFTLYGNAKKYVGGLLDNCKLINTIYPEFWIYVYLGNDFDWELYREKFSDIQNIKYIQSGCSGHQNSLHRFLPIDFDEVGCVFSRDTDSRINNRDQYCINTFLNSDKKFQIIRDHCAHGGHPILAGMWGIKKGLITFPIRDIVMSYSETQFGCDQNFLREFIYPVVKHDIIVFDEFFNYEGISQKIDVAYEELEGLRDFVGNVIIPIDFENPFGDKHTSVL